MKKEVRIANWPNGQRKNEIPYANGKKHGLAQWWYPNGQKWYEIPYVNGKLHGLTKWWYENGQKWYEIPYVNGQIHSLLRWWHSDGSLDFLKKWQQDQWVWEIHFYSEEYILGNVEVELFFHPTPELKSTKP